MTPDKEWDDIRGRPAPLLGVAGMSMLRFALLFGSAAVALALILAPMADRYSKSAIAGNGRHRLHGDRLDQPFQQLCDPPKRPAEARRSLHHPRRRPIQGRLLTCAEVCTFA